MRITIEHENGNTVTGTPEDVLNHGHLMPGWKYRSTEPVTLDDVSEATSLNDLIDEARSEGVWCCEVGCGSGACETCPCCSAGWCVSGVDGVPEDQERWLDVAAEHNPVAGALRAASAADPWIPHASRALRIHDTWGTPDDPDGKVRPTSDYTELSARMANALRAALAVTEQGENR